MEVADQLHAAAALTPRTEPTVPTGQKAGWVGSRASLYTEMKRNNPIFFLAGN